MLLRYRNRVHELEAKVAQLETELKLVQLEWAETWDKIDHALRRARKRDRDAAKGEIAPPQLEAFLDPISARVLGRRRKDGVSSQGDSRP